MSKEQVRTGGFPLLGIMFLIFMTLKLTGHIAWSWWWVTAPLWGGVAVILAILVVFLVVTGFGALLAKILNR